MATVTLSEIYRVILAAVLAGAAVLRSKRKQSLSPSGLVAAFAVGFLGLAASYRFGFTVLVFYASSTRLTQFKAQVKKRLEDDYKEGGQRSAVQVLCASFTATCISLVYVYCYRNDGPVSAADDTWASALLLAYLGFYAAATGDTWASEVGLVVGINEETRDTLACPPSLPVLVIPPFPRVPRGTNGGVSLVGTLASVAGGFAIGLAFWLLGVPYSHAASRQFLLPVAGAVAGGFGSLVDSVLGALLQGNWLDPATGRIVTRPPSNADEVKIRKLQHVSGQNVLSNEMVNLLSCSLTAAATTFLVFCF